MSFLPERYQTNIFLFKSLLTVNSKHTGTCGKLFIRDTTYKDFGSSWLSYCKWQYDGSIFGWGHLGRHHSSFRDEVTQTGYVVAYFIIYVVAHYGDEIFGT